MAQEMWCPNCGETAVDQGGTGYRDPDNKELHLFECSACEYYVETDPDFVVEP